MSKKFLNDIDMDQNQVLNMRVQNLESAPSNAKEGQIYYDSTTKRMYKYNGTKWEALSEIILIRFDLINLEPGCAAQDIYNAFTNSENATKEDAEAVLAKMQSGTPTFIIKDNVNIVIPVTTYIMASRNINLNFILQNTLYYFTIFTNIITKKDWSLPMNNKKAYGLVPEDWLDSDDTTSPLSANQGRVLKELVDQANEVEISDTEPTDTNKKLFIDIDEEPEGDFVFIGDIIDNLESTSSTDALSANQGRVLNEKIDHMLDFFYPVGTYYETSNKNFNPNITWGGTWEQDTIGLVTAGAVPDSGSYTLHGSLNLKVGEWKGNTTHYHLLPMGHYTGSAGTDYRIWDSDWGAAPTSHKKSVKVGNWRYPNPDKAQSTNTCTQDTSDWESNVQPTIGVIRWHRIA